MGSLSSLFDGLAVVTASIPRIWVNIFYVKTAAREAGQRDAADERGL